MAAALSEKAACRPVDFCQLDRECGTGSGRPVRLSAMVASGRRAPGWPRLALPGDDAPEADRPAEAGPDPCTTEAARMLRRGGARPGAIRPGRGADPWPSGAGRRGRSRMEW